MAYSTITHNDETMVYLAITAKRLSEALLQAAPTGAAVWCGADAMSEADFDANTYKNLTRFNYALGGGDVETLKGALDTIDQHHPGEFVLVEDEAAPC